MNNTFDFHLILWFTASYIYNTDQGWVQVQLYLSNLYLSTIFEYLYLYLNTFLFIPMYLYLYLSTKRKYLKFEVLHLFTREMQPF